MDTNTVEQIAKEAVDKLDFFALLRKPDDYTAYNVVLQACQKSASINEENFFVGQVFSFQCGPPIGDYYLRVMELGQDGKPNRYRVVFLS